MTDDFGGTVGSVLGAGLTLGVGLYGLEMIEKALGNKHKHPFEDSEPSGDLD